MKKLVGLSLFIFWTVVTSTLVAGFVFYQGKASAPASQSPGPAIQGQAGVILNAAEIVKHNSINDCWMIINGKVYNVTSYLSFHPGGIGTILPYCGGEATAAFDTKGGRGNPHSGNANALLADYYIGDFNQTVGQQQINGTNLPQPNTGSRRRYEYEDD